MLAKAFLQKSWFKKVLCMTVLISLFLMLAFFNFYLASNFAVKVSEEKIQMVLQATKLLKHLTSKKFVNKKLLEDKKEILLDESLTYNPVTGLIEFCFDVALICGHLWVAYRTWVS